MGALTRANIIDGIKTLSVLRGEFTLRSGRKSNVYVDKFRIASDPTLLSHVGGFLAAKVFDITNSELCDVEQWRLCIAAPELGAVPFAAATCLNPLCPWPMIIVRKKAKDYGNLTNSRLEGLIPKQPVCILIEDVVTTGGAVLSALDALDEAGIACDDVIAVLDREEGGADAIRARRPTMTFHSIFTRTDLGL